MDQGVLGFSTGLWYAPGSYSSAEEIIELAKIANRITFYIQYWVRK